jgi:hypothetical protein
MAERLGVRGHDDSCDYVCEITHTKDDLVDVLGTINTATGQYTPPELLETMKGYEKIMVEGVRLNLNKAKIPMSRADFEKNGLKISIEK